MITGNEPAFPEMHDHGVRELNTGITIRQQFAMAAMQGFCAAGYGEFKDTHTAYIAELAVRQADALIKELNKTEGQ